MPLFQQCHSQNDEHLSKRERRREMHEKLQEKKHQFYSPPKKKQNFLAKKNTVNATMFFGLILKE